MTISGGLVSIEDGTKKAEDYAPARKVRVELKFDVPEGSDEFQRIIDDVARIANNKVEELLGRKAAVEIEVVEPPKKSGKPKPKEVVVSVPVSDTKAADEAKAAYAAKCAAEEAAAKSKPDELDELLGDSGLAPEPISDKQLLDAIKAVNTNPAMIQRIKETVKAFCPREDKAGFRVADIAQEHRQMFIDKLQGLPTD